MTTSDIPWCDLETPNSLERDVQKLRQQALEHLAKMLADEWASQREQD